MREKRTFAAFEMSDGGTIHRIPLEAFPRFWVYVYLVQKDSYCALIDAGSGTDSSHENLLSGFHQAGIQPSDLTHIFLTHAHIDHFGGLAKLRALTSAKIVCHELDVQTVAHHESRLAWTGRRFASFLDETGLTEEKREQVLNVYRLSKAFYRSVPVDFTYEALEMQLGPFEFVHLPGHCPGHVAIRVDDVIFCGDIVVEGVTPHLSPESITPYSGLDHYLESLTRLQYWSNTSRFLFNGHDDVITDLPRQVESTKQNILRRMSKAVEAFHQPLTTEEVCRFVYGDTGGYNLLLVIEKTGAYVEYLYERGMIEIVNPGEVERGEAARYRRLRDEMNTMAELERAVYGNTRILVDN